MVGVRRKARVLALQVLYEVDSVGHEAEEVVTRLLANAGLREENEAFTRELVSGVIHNKPKIDQNIRSFAPAWPIEQISVIDRNILRLAIFEILFDDKVPVKVAINEAVELVNGVLGSVSALANR